MRLHGKVRGMSQYYRRGLEHMYIEIDKRAATGVLPYQNGQRVAIDLIIGEHRYRAGIRTTVPDRAVWISPDLNDGTPKLAEVLRVV